MQRSVAAGLNSGDCEPAEPAAVADPEEEQVKAVMEQVRGSLLAPFFSFKE